MAFSRSIAGGAVSDRREALSAKVDSDPGFAGFAGFGFAGFVQPDFACARIQLARERLTRACGRADKRCGQAGVACTRLDWIRRRALFVRTRAPARRKRAAARAKKTAGSFLCVTGKKRRGDWLLKECLRIGILVSERDSGRNR